MTLAGGDEAKGIVQQNFSGGETPALGGGAPPLQQSAGPVGHPMNHNVVHCEPK